LTSKRQNVKTLNCTGIVKDGLCQRAVVPAGADWPKDIARYESSVLAERG